jgi:LPXTG-site transpeptidase (sortase) family protein
VNQRVKSFISALLALAGALVFLAGAAAVRLPGDSGTEAAVGLATDPPAGLPAADTSIETATSSTIAATTTTTAITATPTQSIDDAVAEAAMVRPPPHRATRVRIDKIDVDAAIIDLGLHPDRTLEVPEDIRLTGWYTGRSVPGEPGPSVVVGHVDSAALGPGVFWRLRELDIGDVVTVERSDGSVAEFRVTETELVLKDEFPTEKVYGSVGGAELRLITCGGTFDQSVRTYLGNLIVYAEHVGTTQPPPPPDLDQIA